jgi:fumarate reductase subunit D
MSAPVKRTIAPVFWLLFGAGGMLSALFGAGMVIATGFILPQTPPSYAAALDLARNPLVKLVLLAVISLFFWHGAERLYLTLKDMRAGPKPLLKLATYGLAALLTLATLALLLSIGF